MLLLSVAQFCRCALPESYPAILFKIRSDSAVQRPTGAAYLLGNGLFVVKWGLLKVTVLIVSYLDQMPYLLFEHWRTLDEIVSRNDQK